MFPALPIAQSALQAADRRLRVSANNTANFQTAEFRPQQVSAHERKEGGVGTTVHYANGSNYKPSADLDALLHKRSFVREYLQQQQARLAYQANLKTMQTADEMNRDVVDIIA